MKMAQKIHYSNRVSLLWSAILGLPSLLYLLIISFKNAFYRYGWLKEQKVGAKVICVGNLTTGGVGKTPIVCALADYLVSKNTKVAVISRGYGGTWDNSQVNVVKDYEKILADDAVKCGDEPYLIAQNTKGAPVLTCADRVKAANYAIEHFNCEVILLDDGFSNRKIYKDINILVVDAQKKFGNSFVLPLGPLREPVLEIKRAQKIVLVDKTPPQTLDESYDTSYIDPAAPPTRTQKELAAFQNYGIPVFLCKMTKDKYYNLLSMEDFEPKDYDNAVAFSAIGQPNQFYDYLQNDFNVVDTQDFNDHHIYSGKDVEELLEIGKDSNAGILITTEKDATKLLPLIKNSKLKDLPVFLVLKLKLEVDLEGLVCEKL